MPTTLIGLAVASAAAAAQTAIDAAGVGPAPAWNGMPLDVLLWACAGAIASLAFSKPAALEAYARSPTTVKLFLAAEAAFTLVANAFVTTLAVMALPHLPKVGVMFADIPSIPMAGLGAAFFQPVLRFVSAIATRATLAKLGLPAETPPPAGGP